MDKSSNNLISRARALRKASTDAEHLLWKSLRGRRLNGFKFRRQVMFEPYIVDFVCIDACLIVEADGGQHADQKVYDSKRTAELEALSYRVLRFWNHEILNNHEAVLEKIISALIEFPLMLSHFLVLRKIKYILYKTPTLSALAPGVALPIPSWYRPGGRGG